MTLNEDYFRTFKYYNNKKGANDRNFWLIAFRCRTIIFMYENTPVFSFFRGRKQSVETKRLIFNIIALNHHDLIKWFRAVYCFVQCSYYYPSFTTLLQILHLPQSLYQTVLNKERRMYRYLILNWELNVLWQ